MSSSGISGLLASGGEKGARRKKLAGYLKSANELRQSYSQSYGIRGQVDGEYDDHDDGIPGAFPDVAIARNGDEEMILFPSYARRQHKRPKPRVSERPPPTQDPTEERNGGDAEYWKREWERYEDDKAIVDVDVRGWIYAPHRGPMNRKNRLLMGLARHLSGVPAPSVGSRAPSQAPSLHRDRAAEQEEELVLREAESITRRGRQEADVAGRGGYSEKPNPDSDQARIYSNTGERRTPSPMAKEPRPGDFPHPLTNSSLASTKSDNAPGPGGLAKRASWNQPSEMGQAELAMANANLMARLRPFLSNPLISTPLTIFFYNDSTSQSRSTITNEAGHFTFRAALDFVPTHVRVLATPKLSATEVVHITEPHGVSMISDIDDTIKHSAISSGAKEIFRNTFIRDLGDLSIEGVKEWYTQMASMGVQMHYVSNSPWQLYPVLVSFFSAAGLPPGSFHLKQYSGMLQGIFEPVAERKKGTLERILHDFPDRRFILVGDSGEADLELYTEVVVANPSRILGVFIRDVTTMPSQGFFDQSPAPRSSSVDGSRTPRSAPSTTNGNGSLHPDRASARPSLPPRRPTAPDLSHAPSSSAEEDLIDFREPTPAPPPPNPFSRSKSDLKLQSTASANSPSDPSNPTKSPPPRRPSKPLALRSASGEARQIPSMSSTTSSSSISRKPPPAPPKPRTLSSAKSPADPSPLSQSQLASPPSDTNTNGDRYSYREAAGKKLASAYNALPALPSATSYWTGASAEGKVTKPSSDALQQQQNGQNGSLPPRKTRTGVPPPVPPRRTVTSYPAAAANYASSHLGWSSGEGSNGSAGGGGYGGQANPAQAKKEELWRRRFARAKEVLDERGVVLRSWRVGSDVAHVVVRLVEGAEKGGRGGKVRRGSEKVRRGSGKVGGW